MDGNLVYSNKHAEDFFDNGKHLLPSQGWLNNAKLGKGTKDEYLIQRGDFNGGITFELEIEGGFDIDKLQFKCFADGLDQDEKPHICLNKIIYDGEEYANQSWFSDFGKVYTGIGTINVDRDVYVIMDESTVMVTS